MSEGFIAIYRWRVEPGQEAAFRETWRAITDGAKHHGSLGSTLALDEDGIWTAIALWPSIETRDAAFAQMDESPAWPPCERLSETRLAVVDDRWARSPFVGES